MRNCFETPHLLLRAPEPSDTDFCYEVENDISEWESTENYMPASRYDIELFIKNYIPDPIHTSQIRLIMTERHAGNRVGIIDLFDINLLQGRAGIGVYVERTNRRRGYALEALQSVAEYSSSHLGLRLLYAHIFSRNKKSLRLFEQAGYERVGLLSEWFRRGKIVSDAVIMVKKL